MTDRSEPTTAAGRALLEWRRRQVANPPTDFSPAKIDELVADMAASILAVEAEARQPDSEALRVAIGQELSVVGDSQFDQGAAAAYHFALSFLAALPPSEPPA